VPSFPLRKTTGGTEAKWAVNIAGVRRTLFAHLLTLHRLDLPWHVLTTWSIHCALVSTVK
jgi:hypothetical protein